MKEPPVWVETITAATTLVAVIDMAQ